MPCGPAEAGSRRCRARGKTPDAGGRPCAAHRPACSRGSLSRGSEQAGAGRGRRCPLERCAGLVAGERLPGKAAAIFGRRQAIVPALQSTAHRWQGAPRPRRPQGGLRTLALPRGPPQRRLRVMSAPEPPAAGARECCARRVLELARLACSAASRIRSPAPVHCGPLLAKRAWSPCPSCAAASAAQGLASGSCA